MYGIFAWKRFLLWPRYEMGKGKGFFKNTLLVFLFAYTIAITYSFTEGTNTVLGLTSLIMLIGVYLCLGLFWSVCFAWKRGLELMAVTFPATEHFGAILKLIFFWPERAFKKDSDNRIKIWLAMLIFGELVGAYALASGALTLHETFVFSRVIWLVFLFTGCGLALDWIQKPRLTSF